MNTNSMYCADAKNCSCEMCNECCGNVNVSGCGNPMYNVFSWNSPRKCCYRPELCAIDMLYYYLTKGEAAELYVNNREFLDFLNEVKNVYETKEHVLEILQDLSDLINDSDFVNGAELQEVLEGKQDTLVSGKNIKTINGEPVLGDGDIEVVVDVDNHLDGDSENPVQNKVITAEVITIKGGSNKSIAELDAQDKSLGQMVDSLETAVGTGGSVDTRIQSAVSAEAAARQAKDEQLLALYEALTQSHIIVVADHTEVSSPETNIIYREPGDTSYSDWMYYDGNWYKMAEYDNAIDDEPTAGSDNLVKSGGVYKQEDNIRRNKVQQGWMEKEGISFADEAGHSILDLSNRGRVHTPSFDSDATPYCASSKFDLDFEDEKGKAIVIFSKGHIKTKYFDSEKIESIVPSPNIVQKPINPIPIYLTCNNLNTSNNWGIGTRNKSLSAYLDHFFHTNKEVFLRFDNGATYKTFTQKIVGNGTESGWNNNVDKYENIVAETLNNEDIIQFKVRSILNSVTKDIYPKVLQIGDSVTEGWFANYPIVTGAPIQSWSWAKYYFEKDKAENGSKYDSLFVGTRTKNVVNYDNVSYTAYAYGLGGKTAKWYCTNSDSAFYTQNGFSLASYLAKYKTLADDGVTRLVVGSTAGTEVTNVNAWDLCTPNVVVIQLGMNDVLSEWKTYMQQIINSIKNEFPTMKIIISVLDACSCNFPSLYPNYQGIFFDNYNNDHTKLMEAYSYAIDNWQDETNGIYVIYSGMVMPMPITCNVRETEGNWDGQNKKYIGVDSVERVPHPSRYAHQEIGYLLYSAIKWILT